MKKGEWHRVKGKLVRRRGRKTPVTTPRAATIRQGPPSIDQLADAVVARILDRVAEKLAEQL